MTFLSPTSKYVDSFCVLGSLHPGDEIRELDGECVDNKSIENLQATLVSVNTDQIGF